VEYFLTLIEDSLNELNAKGIKKVHNFIRKEEERETWLVVILVGDSSMLLLLLVGCYRPLRKTLSILSVRMK